ncbi:Cell division ATP-binding protein FtsE, partial [termite gut metagenome]
MEKEIRIDYQNVEIYQQDICVLNQVELEVSKGDFIYITGKVGTGKTSLLKTIYGELDITGICCDVLGYNMKKLRKRDIPRLRRRIGIVFQDFQLLTDRTVYDNLYFVLRATGWKKDYEIDSRIEEVLEQVGMSDKSHKIPNELSGGEQQHVVIARAILNSPQIILADEPTGNLDIETGMAILELLYNISKTGTSVIVTTHNLGLM